MRPPWRVYCGASCLIGLAFVPACIPRQYYRPPRTDCESNECRTARAFRTLNDIIDFDESYTLVHGRPPLNEEGLPALLGLVPRDPWGNAYLNRLSPQGIPMVVSLGPNPDPFNPDMTVPLWGHDGPWVYAGEPWPLWAERAWANDWKLQYRQRQSPKEVP
jgi:hypothetical protein